MSNTETVSEVQDAISDVLQAIGSADKLVVIMIDGVGGKKSKVGKETKKEEKLELDPSFMDAGDWDLSNDEKDDQMLDIATSDNGKSGGAGVSTDIGAILY